MAEIRGTGWVPPRLQDFPEWLEQLAERESVELLPWQVDMARAFAEGKSVVVRAAPSQERAKAWFEECLRRFVDGDAPNPEGAALERLSLSDNIHHLAPPPGSAHADVGRAMRRQRVPAGIPDYIGLQPLVDITITPGIEVTYDGRPAVVCVPPRADHMGPVIGDHVLIRYLDGKRERVLVSPYDCAVGIE